MGWRPTRDGVRDRHERRVQRWCDTPDDSVTDETRQAEGEEIVHERRSSELAEGDSSSHSTSHKGDLVPSLLPWCDNLRPCNFSSLCL